jgi:hypothetical protein
MRTYLQSFFAEFDYPEDARAALLADFDQLTADAACSAAFAALLNTYAQDINCTIMDLQRAMVKLSAQAGIHEYVGNMLLFICMTKTQRQYYQAEGISDEIWRTSMADLRFKLMECQSVHGIWGTFVPTWYPGFLQLNRFGFGNLQFELLYLDKDYTLSGQTFPQGMPVVNIHIPRTGKRLDKQVLQESFRQAAEFFQKRYHLDTVIFRCRSWLLFPRHREVMSPESNLYYFLSLFQIIDQGEYENYNEVWRLFDVNYTGDVDQLPQDSSLRRTYADWIRKGEKTGWGEGVFFYPAQGG